MKQFDQFSFRCQTQNQDITKIKTKQNKQSLANIQKQLKLVCRQIQSKFNVNPKVQSYLNQFKFKQKIISPTQPIQSQTPFQKAKQIGRQVKSLWKNTNHLKNYQIVQPISQKYLIYTQKSPKQKKIIQNMKTSFKEGKYGSVIRIASDKNINNSDFQYMLGQSYRIIGQLDKAQKHLRRSISFQRFNWLCYLSLAQLCLQQNQYGRAIPFFKKHLQKYDNIPTRRGLAQALFQCSQYLQCIVQTQQGLKIQKYNPDLLLLRALSYERLGYYGYAQNDITVLHSIQPQYEQKHMKKFIKAQTHGKTAQAARILSRLQTFNSVKKRINQK